MSEGMDQDLDALAEQVPSQPPSEGDPTPSGGLWRTLRWYGLLILAAVFLAVVSGFFVGRSERSQTEASTVQQLIQEQYALGLIDLDQGRYEIAKQRFEYIIRLDPTFPEIADRLAEALLGINAPLASPTPIQATPTPNLAPVEEIFDQAGALYAAGDWTGAIQTLLALKAKDETYRAVAVDGMMFGALRNRGVQSISEQRLLEEGIYDLTLAGHFAPLDETAINWRNWAQLYLTANSYFGLNWSQAVFYFEVVYNTAPGIHPDVYWKFALAMQRVGDQYIDAGDPCVAVDFYDNSLIVQYSDGLVPTATQAVRLCRDATRPTEAPATETPTPTPEGGGSGEGGGGGE